MKLFKDSRKLPFVLIAAILFSACSGGIVNSVLDNRGNFLPVNDSLLRLEKAGEINIDRSVDGNPLIQKVVLTIKPGFSDKYRLARHDGSIKVFYFFIGLCVALIALCIWYGNDPGRLKGLPILLGFLGVISFGIAIMSIDRAHVKEESIPKITYDSLLNTPDGLKPFWDQHLFK